MFRPMRRFKQQISDTECKEILKNEKRGVLSLLGDDGYPYGLPLSHFYSEEDNKIYFHGAKELANALPRVQCLELEIKHMTGKLVNES